MSHESTQGASVRRRLRVQLALAFLLLCTIGAALLWNQTLPRPTVLAQGSPLPERERQEPEREGPACWVSARGGGSSSFGPVTVAVPSAFTHQGGACIIGDMVIEELLPPPDGLIPATQFALGVWPANDQLEYAQPFELRMFLNAARNDPQMAAGLAFVQYDPATGLWVPLPSEFRPATYQLVTQVRTITPVPKDFSSWGWRTFFAVVRPGQAAPTPAAGGASARFNSNLRGGPGTVYPVVGFVASGQPLTIVAKSANAQWYQLADGKWIAAALVSNPPVVPVATGTAVPAATRPSGAPSQIAAGMLTLTDGALVDLDTGAFSAMGTADLLTTEVDGRLQYLLPLNGARLAVMPAGGVTYEECQAATLGPEPVDLGAVEPNAYVCLRTGQESTAILRLLGGGEAETREIAYTIWR